MSAACSPGLDNEFYLSPCYAGYMLAVPLGYILLSFPFYLAYLCKHAADYGIFYPPDHTCGNVRAGKKHAFMDEEARAKEKDKNKEQNIDEFITHLNNQCCGSVCVHSLYKVIPVEERTYVDTRIEVRSGEDLLALLSAALTALVPVILWAVVVPAASLGTTAAGHSSTHALYGYQQVAVGCHTLSWVLAFVLLLVKSAPSKGLRTDLLLQGFFSTSLAFTIYYFYTVYYQFDVNINITATSSWYMLLSEYDLAAGTEGYIDRFDTMFVHILLAHCLHLHSSVLFCLPCPQRRR